MNRYFEQAKRLLRTGFFHILGGSVLSRLLGFFSTAILVRILTKTEYGVFTCAWNIYSIVLLANGMGMEAGVLQLCSERSGDLSYARRICGFGTRFGLAFDALLMGVLLAVGLFVPLRIGGAGELLILLAALPMGKLLFSLTAAHLRAQKQNQSYARFSVIHALLVLAATAAGALLFRQKGLILGYYAAYALSALLALCRIRSPLFSREGKLDRADRRALLGVSFVSMCNNGLSQLLYLLDVFVLGILTASEDILAAYRVATVIPTALSFLPTSLAMYLYPYFAQKRSDGTWCMRSYRAILLGLGSVNLLICGALILFAPWILRLLFGAVYLDTVPVFRILSVSYFFSGTLRTLSGNLLVTQRKLKFNFFVAVFSGVLNLAADLILIPLWGSAGAALATLLVVLVTGLLNTACLIRTFRKQR